MSGTLIRVSSAFLRQQRPFNLRHQPNYATNPQEAAKKAAEGAKKQFDKLTEGKSREEVVGWIFLGVLGFAIVRKMLCKLTRSKQ